MNLRDLEYLVATTEICSFSKAADKCNTSQPTLSSQIKKMEEYLGVKLFERSNKKVIPTETGLKITELARNILQMVDSIKETAMLAGDPLTGYFKLGAFPTLASYIFPKIVKQVRANMPKLKLVLIEEKTAILLDKLREGKIDAALLALPIEDEILEFKELFEDEFLLAVPSDHFWAGRKKINASEIAGEKLLLLEEGHCLREQALDFCQRAGSTENEEFRATSLETLRQMIKAGTGITLMPQLAITDNEKGISYIKFSKPAPKRKIAMVWRKTSVRKDVIDKICGYI